MNYLTPTDHRAFENHTPITKFYDGWKLCPHCLGHGRWNLRLDCYGQGKHFVGVCDVCNGSGQIRADRTCIHHQWVHVATLGRCYNEYRCALCGEISRVDSSD